MNEDILYSINNRIDQALDYTRRVVEKEEMGERMEECKLKTELFVAKNPLKSIAGGLLAGYIIGKIFSDD